MPSTATNRLQGLTTSVAVKAPCVTVATSNLTLSGLQTVNGVTVTEGDRVLCVGQTDASQNGIYNSSTGNWSRARDFDGDLDVVKGTIVLVNDDSDIAYRVTSDDPTIDADDIELEAVTLVMTQAGIGQALYPRTAAEIAAGITPTDYSIPSHDAAGVVNLFRYGYVGDGVTDDWDAIQDGVDVINQLGGGSLLFPPDTTPRIFVGSKTGTLCSFSNLSGIDIIGYGCTLTVDLSRTIITSLGVCFSFSACSAIRVSGFKTNGPTLDVSNTTVKGVEFVRITNGCSDWEITNNDVTNWLSYVIAKNQDGSGTFLGDSTRCPRGKITGSVNNCWYGVADQFCSLSMDVDILTSTVHRSLFLIGSRMVTAKVRNKNFKAVDVLIQSYQGVVIDGISLRYQNLADSTANGPSNCKIVFADETAGTIRNVSLHMDKVYPNASGGGGGVVEILKLTNASGFDTTDRGHVLENLTISGSIKGSPDSGDTNGGIIITDPSCTFGTGDFFRNITLRDLRIDGNDAYALVSLAMASLTDQITLDNLVSNQNIIVKQANASPNLPQTGSVNIKSSRFLNQYDNQSGPILALEYINAGSATPTAYAAWGNGKTLTTRNAGGDMTWSLPAATVGLEFRAARTDAVRMRLDPNGSEVIRGGTAGQNIYSDSNGAHLHLRCFTAGIWEIESMYGTWGYGG